MITNGSFWRSFVLTIQDSFPGRITLESSPVLNSIELSGISPSLFIPSLTSQANTDNKRNNYTNFLLFKYIKITMEFFNFIITQIKRNFINLMRYEFHFGNIFVTLNKISFD